MTHETVLKNEAIEYLNILENGIYVDATLGGAGHSELILSKLKNGFLYCFDQDDYAISYAEKRLSKYKNFKIIKSNFSDLKNQLSKLGVKRIDGILFDLGLSSFQIDDKTRGFSYLVDEKLDMRMDKNQELTAEYIVNNYEYEKLVKIFYEYGEEKNGSKIANLIIKNRPIKTAFDLVRITDRVNFKDKGHSAKRVFQALRIEVNQELQVLDKVLIDSMDMLNQGGRMVVISFHSLEDRIVKWFFKKNSETKQLKDLPILIEGNVDLKVITKSPIYPSDDELLNNKRSNSAKMRVAEKT